MQAISEVDTQNKDLKALAETLNEHLRAAGAERAKQAFGMGCLIGILPTLLVLIILMSFKVINLVVLFILAIVTVLVWVGIATLIANYARVNAIRKSYHAEAELAINRFIASHNLSRIEFDRVVARLLPQEAPLQQYLYPSGEITGLKE
jgi:hypothetical protein